MTDGHRPAAGRPVPASTYRLQLHSGFGFDAVAALAPYLASLGITHAYLSPILAANPGSTHGYDVVDHARISDDLGGPDALARMVSALRAHGLGAVVDVVPNHMAVPTPEWRNAALWSVLRDGPLSPCAPWFDVDWSVEQAALLMPVLGRRIGQVLEAGELSVDPSGGRNGDETVLRYFDHEFPLRPETERLPMTQLVDRQWYRLAHWRVGDQEVNYRRFFDIDTLAALRQEDADVFEASHRLVINLVRSGDVDGLRIDHPDGLADPREYLRRLSDRTGGAWVVVEKILEAGEQLPDDWMCSGTTGYDSLRLVNGVFHDGAGTQALTALAEELAGEREDWTTCARQAKREVIEGGQYAEVHRLVDLLVDICGRDPRLRDHTRRDLHDCLVEILVAFDRYRAYVVPGEPADDVATDAVDAATDQARAALPEDQVDALAVVHDLLLGRPIGDPALLDDDAVRRRAELVTRFQQTCGPVMAKGVEDTASYRWVRLVSLNEVGGDPSRIGLPPEELHAFAAESLQRHPAAMTTLSTHDTKRSEDVRARIAVISELPDEWADVVRALHEVSAPYRSSGVDGRLELLVWQTAAGTWPISAERLAAYAEKVAREAKLYTSWTSPDLMYELALRDFVTGLVADPEVRGVLDGWTDRTASAVRATTLGQKLLQLVLPGVPDVFQGCEAIALTLVDPDNRQPVDHTALAASLSRLDANAGPVAGLSLAEAKLLVTSRALRLRREHPEWFLGDAATYGPVSTTSGSALGIARGDASGVGVVAVTTRLSVSLERFGGWGEHTVSLPDAQSDWLDVLTGRSVAGGTVALAELLVDLPVALLVRE
ncbi:MAG: malto-oligosyltrehalose synthase [Actinomycetales bacterium]